MAKGWDIDPASFTKLIEEDVNKRVRIIGIALLSEVVSRSPVDTGYFRNNTTVSFNTPFYGETGFTRGDKLPKGSTNGVESFDEGWRAINNDAARIPYPIIYIQNNTVYAERLENGHSQQAPAGIFATAIHGVSQAYK